MRTVQRGGLAFKLLAALLLLALPAAAQVSPLTVTLATGAACPVPLGESPLLRVPVGCPAPWDGVLYTEAEHDGTRTRVVRLDAAAIAERARADAGTAALMGCRKHRDDIVRLCDVEAAALRGRLDVLSAVAVQPAPKLWPWAALSGALAVTGSGAGNLTGRSALESTAYGAAGAALGVAVALIVEWAE
jgi:hypothetical protein